MWKNLRRTTPSPAGKGQEELSRGSKHNLSPNEKARVPKMKSKVMEWMGAGLPGKRKQH